MKSKLVLTLLVSILAPALISVAGCSSEADPPATPATGGTTGVAGATTGGAGTTGGGGTTGGAGTTSTAGTTGGGGGGGGAVCDAPNTIFKLDMDQGGCNGSICHSAANVALYPPDLETADPGPRLKNIASATDSCSGRLYIDSANIEGSLMLNKLLAAPACGIQMPFAKPALAQDKIDCIRSWVTSIAQQ
ncbi:MAG TPA: hypothetical protein VHO25_22155 [Polyangiaceae bacterium]|nr:hypothetical protein [Polyangiaceae bacterium]